MPRMAERQFILFNVAKHRLGGVAHASSFDASNDAGADQSLELVLVLPPPASVLVNDEIEHQVHDLYSSLGPAERELEVDVPPHTFPGTRP